MNKELVLEMVQELVEKTVKDGAEEDPDLSLDGLLENLYQVNGRRGITLPKRLPKKPEAMLEILRNEFRSDVTKVSLVMSHFFPEDYLYYRVSSIEPEIFEGLEFFSEYYPEVEFGFTKIGKRGLDRYLELNAGLLEFGDRLWPDERDHQLRMGAFLYQGLRLLFAKPAEYQRHWIIATRQEHWKGLDKSDQIGGWSVSKEVSEGDLIFVYRTKPRSAITDIFRVSDTPRFDPVGSWDGFWAAFDRVCALDDIPFSQMKLDPVLGQWTIVRRSFQGVMTEYVPHNVFNRLLDFVPNNVKEEHELVPEEVPGGASVEDYENEREFEEKRIESLLRDWQFEFKCQWPIRRRVGSQSHTFFMDHLVRHNGRDITLFENKRWIGNDDDLGAAADQGLSYAQLLGLPSFVVAAPQGMWLYRVDGSGCAEDAKVTFGDHDAGAFEGFRARLLSLAMNAKK